MNITAKACAKINLTLDVYSKREDGYHSLSSIMQSISLHDILQVCLAEKPGIHFKCEAPNQPNVPSGEDNLAVKAALLVLEWAQNRHIHIQGGIDIMLHKNIPSQAGLGGGSSDAAAAIAAVNSLLHLQMPQTDLLQTAALLGSDVPFFLLSGTVLAQGRGEKLTPLPDLPVLNLVVVKPDNNVPTAWAYQQLDAVPQRYSHRATARAEKAINEQNIIRLLQCMSNDFEQPVFTHMPALAIVQDDMRMAGLQPVHLCGSGSALFGIAADQAAAEKSAALLQKRYAQVYTAHTLTREQASV